MPKLPKQVGNNIFISKKKFTKGTIFLSFFFITFFYSENKIYSQNFNLKIINNSNNTVLHSRNYSDSSLLFSRAQFFVNKLKNKGFAAASLDSFSIVRNKFAAYIYKGEKYKFGKINFIVADTSFNTLILNNKQVKRRVFSQNNFNELNNKIVEFYENSGFPFVQIKTQNSYFNSDYTFNSDIKILPGNKIFFNDIFIKGNVKISQKFISKFLKIKQTEIYNQKIVSDISSKISTSGFLSEINPPEISFFNNKADIYLYLKNSKTNNFSADIGFFDQKSGKFGLNGNADLNLKNSLNRADEIKFNWTGAEGGTQNLKASFSLPYIFASSFGFSVKTDIFKQDSSFVNVDFKIAANYYASALNFISFFIENKSSNILQFETADSTMFLPGTGYSTGVEFFYRKTDNFYFPMNAFEFNLLISSGKRIINDTQIPVSILELSAKKVFTIHRKSAVKFNENLKYILTKQNLYFNEMIFFGGINSLRGFYENAFSATAYNVFKIESAYRFEKNSEIFGFFDFGVYKTDISGKISNDIPHSLGLGLNLSSKAGIVQIIFALGKSKILTANSFQSKIHIGYFVVF